MAESRTAYIYRAKDKNNSSGKMSLKRQIASVKNYCAEKGITIIDTVKEPMKAN